MSNSTLGLDQLLQDYINQVGYREANILKALRLETQQMGYFSRMQISPEQGQLMSLLIRLTGAAHYLEVGTFTGYSSLVCAMALPEHGRVLTCDISEEWTQTARRYWEQAGVQHKISLRLGPAVETLETIIRNGEPNRFDIAFIDADKANYTRYYELCYQLIRQGGCILVDNTLWSGRVADPSANDEDTQAIRELNKRIAEDDRVLHCLIPIGDGLTLIYKK